MSWSIVGSTTWFSNQASGTPVTGSVVWPSGADQPGDIGIMTITCRGDTAITVPADWTLLESRVSALFGSTDAPSHYVYGFVRASSAPSMSISIPLYNYCSLFCYRHSSGDAEIGAIAKSLFDSAVTTHAADPGFSSLAADTLVVLCAANGRAATYSSLSSVNQTTASGSTDPTSAPSGAWVERADHGSIGTYSARSALFDVIVTEGSTGTVTTTVSAASKGTFISVALVGTGSPGTPPVGTVTISAVDPGETTAEVTYSYDDTDQTGFEYRIDGGTAASIGASPATITGLTASTEYDIEVRAVNSAGAGAWSAVSAFTTDAASDVTAPVLSSPTGTATGPTTADGSVSTDEGNGTLYAVVTTSATPPSAADIRSGAGAAYATNQSVTTTGVQNVSATVLTSETTYYWHFLHDDAAANASNIATSASFTTDAVAGTVTITDPLKNNAGTVLVSQTGVKIAVLHAGDFASVHEQTGLTTDAAGLLPTISDALIVPGTNYHVAILLTDGSVGITGAITAS